MEVSELNKILIRHTEAARLLYCSNKDMCFLCKEKHIPSIHKPNTNIYLIPRYILELFVTEITAPGFLGITRKDGSYIFPPFFLAVKEKLSDVEKQESIIIEARKIVNGEYL